MRALSPPLQRNAWLLIAICVFLVGAIVSAVRIYQTQTALFWNYRTGTWLVVEAQAEFHNALSAVKSFRIDPSAAALEKLQIRFDVFWSRVPLILESQEGIDIRRIDAILPNTRKIAAKLPLLDADLQRITVEDAASATPFERRLEQLHPLFEEMTRVVLVQDELRYRTGSLLRDTGWTAGAFLLAIGAGIVLIIGNLVNTRRIRTLLAQREAIDQVRATQLAAIESSGEGIAMFDRRGRLDYSNEAFHQLVGDQDRTANLHSWRRFLSRKGARTLLQGLRAPNRQEPWKGELTGRTAAGTERDWEAHVMPRSEGGFIAVIRDLTDRKAAERERTLLQQQLHRVEKMDAVGRLAGGVAHDFNNILAAIFGFGSLLELDLHDRPEERTMVQQILTAAERGKELVQSIMTFSRTEKAERATVEIGAVCREAATMAALSIPGPAVFETAIEPETLAVTGSATQINRAILNLCINARDALEGNRGTVRLAVDRVAADDGSIAELHELVPAAPQQAMVKVEPLSETRTRAWVRSLGPVPAFYARIRVSDDGTGISRGIMEKMFDPFFTTKDVGRGTGLGLASVLGIVTAHGGAITVDSTIGKGTAFDILLPLQEAKVPAIVTGPTLVTGEPQSLADMHVLLVDDDPNAGNALAAILQKIGCEVSYCGSGAEALEVIGDEPDWFDLVVTDLAMPTMSGLDLAGHLRERKFARPIVLASARLQDASLEDRARLGIEFVIAKPFTLSEVAAVIWSIAGARAAQKSDEQQSRDPVCA